MKILNECISGPSHVTLGKPELGPFISDYEPLSYDREPVHRSPSRHKRSLSAGRRVSEDPVELSFSAHDRDFNLRLFADHSVFHPGYKVTGPLDRPVTGVEHSLYEVELQTKVIRRFPKISQSIWLLNIV